MKKRFSKPTDVFPHLHPHTKKILQQINLLVEEEERVSSLTRKQAAKAWRALQKEGQSHEDLGRLEGIIQAHRPLPQTTLNTLKCQRIDQLLHPQYKVDMLGGVSYEKAQHLFLDHLKQAFKTPTHPKLMVWGKEIMRAFEKPMADTPFVYLYVEIERNPTLKAWVQLDHFVRRVYMLTDMLTNAPKWLEQINQPCVSQDKGFPLKDQRSRLAKVCFNVGVDKLEDVREFVHEPSLFKQWIRDAFLHQQLGCALLDGCPKAIFTAYQAAQVSQDGLPLKIDDFIYQEDGLFGPAYQQSIRATKEKRALVRALGKEGVNPKEKEVPPASPKRKM